MTVKADHWIVRMCQEHGMIEPFEPSQVRDGKVSFGTSSYGYDFRISNEFKILRPDNAGIIDPKADQDQIYETVTAEEMILKPRSFVLANTVEYFRIPRNIITICYGKSTYARCGVFINVTPFEPEWEGHATISIVNSGDVPVKIYPGEGIGQLLFLESNEPCKTSYADKKGKYQAQKTITTAKL